MNRHDYEGMITQIAGSAWQRRNSPRRTILRSINWLIVLAFVAALVGLGAILWFAEPTAGFTDPSYVGPVTLLFVIVGWTFSLCMHEFGHAAAAVLGGDNSLSTQKYLTFNPLVYVNPLMSIGLPVLFILLGGIGLPGGAVYLDRSRLRNSNWQVYVSLAGPLGNVIFTLLLIAPFQVALRTGHIYLASGVAVLAFFEIFAIIINLLPIPPLDGFHAIQDWLPRSWQYSPWVNGYYGVMLLFLAFWLIPPLNEAFQVLVSNASSKVGTDLCFTGLGPGNCLSNSGFYTLMFWRH